MSIGTMDRLPNVVAVATAANYGRFAIGPVEAGIGTPLGNALRRILLSSLPGTAVTSVRIQNVYHEFSCIPFVREDVTEIVLNVKQMRLRSYSERPVRLQLSKHGQGEVRASDIELPANVELVNPEQMIATVDSDEGAFEMELTVERGRGYVSFEAREGLAIGVIPVDAIFSPIPKVNYIVEPASYEVLSTRAEDSEEVSTLTPEEVEGQEQVVVEIWTDGTIDAGEALSLAAQYLAQHSSIISNFNRQAPALQERDSSIVAIPPQLFEMSVEDLNLSMRTYNCLKRSGITKVGQVLRMDRKELLSLRNFGEKSFDELYQSLESREVLPEGTPLAVSVAQAQGLEGEEGAEGLEGIEGDEDGEESLDDVDVAYPDTLEATTDETAYMEPPGVGGLFDGQGYEVVEGAGMSEGSMKAAAGIFVDDVPTAGPVDLSADASTAEGGRPVGAPGELVSEGEE
ncbi:MAG TPA: DNA-directed RNA polymerase subunit alpha [Chloroflexia bacterium]|nr:DNA-directed RNA polymerase subunit alpha [Chloroflexia bacterium]